MDQKRDDARPSAAFDLMFGEPWRAWRRMLAAPSVVAAALRPRDAATESRVLLREGTHTLLHYPRRTPATHAEPVLLCYALVNRPYILDLERERSVVRRYLDAGFEVYMIDWGVPTYADRGLSLTHYVRGFLAKAVAAVLRRHARPDLHLLGYCMGGTMAAMHTALEPQTVKTLALLAAPREFSGRESLLNLWTRPETFDVDRLLELHGNAPAWFLQSCFLFMSPVRNFIEKPIAFWEHMDDPRSVESAFALERWLNDNIPVAGETFRQFVKDLYQRNGLVRGEIVLDGRRVDLSRIACPLLLLTAANDHLVPPEATEGIRPYVASDDVRAMSSRAGHVGLVVGGSAHEKLWPEVTRWVAERSTLLSAPALPPINHSESHSELRALTAGME
jgi:polyhydroxyalkanoate synthase